MFYYRVTDDNNNVSYEERPIRSDIVGGEEIDETTFNAELSAFLASLNTGVAVIESDASEEETAEPVGDEVAEE